MSLFSLIKLYDFERYFLHKISKKAFSKHDKAPFAFDCPNPYSYFKKGSQKCSHSNDFFQCTELNKKKKRLNQRFSSVLILRIECLLNFGEHNVFAKFW